MTEQTVATLIRQDSGMRDRTRSYLVLLDGRKVAEIWNTQTVDIAVEPGDHTLRLKIDWTGSKTLTFSADAGDRLVFSCSSGSAAFALIDGVRSIFHRDEWIELQRVGSPG